MVAFHTFGVGILMLTLMNTAYTAVIDRPSVCDRPETFFKAQYVYTYKYVVETSSSFTGVTEDTSGSQIECTVTIEVPRKCEILLQLSECSLRSKDNALGDYREVEDGTEFEADLERYSVYFQTDKGVLAKDTIIVDEGETIEVLNFKRGLLSALQFQIVETKDYQTPLPQTDVFGECPTQYTFSTDADNTVTTYRNLRDCHIRQIFKMQLNNLMTTIRQQEGGFLEGEISEGIYPFVSDVTCHYKIGDNRRLKSVTCDQQQYYKPLSYMGDILATAMANISQSLTLTTTKKTSMPQPSVDLTGRSVIDIKFDFGVDLDPVVDVEQFETTMTDLVTSYIDVKYADVPEKFGDLVMLFRSADQAMLHDYMTELWACEGEACDDPYTFSAQKFFLNGLEACGTDACILSFLHCISMDHVGPLQKMMFLDSLSHIPTVSDNVQTKLKDYCMKSGETKCWLVLGSVLSTSVKATDPEFTSDSTLGIVLSHTVEIVERNCRADAMVDTERDFIEAAKTIENIGIDTVRKYYNTFPDLEKPVLIFASCFDSPAIPITAKRVILRIMDGTLLPPQVLEALFTILDDVTMDTPLRAHAFSTLSKTTDVEQIKRLVQKMRSPDHEQMKAYMFSSIQSLLENDEPALRDVRDAWKAEKPYFSLKDAYRSYGMSKSYNLFQLFKLPLAEALAGQMTLDIVFDPSSIYLSTMTIGFNYYHGDHKYNIMEVTITMYGFDILLDMIKEQGGVDPHKLYAMYTAAKGQGQEHFTKFQQNILNAVLDMIEKANVKPMLHFDLSMEFKLKGKSVGFLSIQEVIGYIKTLQKSLPPDQPSFTQHVLQQLMASVHKSAFKATEFGSIVKVLPTCAGLPLNMTVQLSGLNKLDNTVQTDTLMYMAKRSPTISASLAQYATMTFSAKGQLFIPVGRFHQSGIKSVIDFGSERDMSAKLTWGFPTPPKGHVTPFSKRLQLDLSPITQNKHKELLFYARGKMYLFDGFTADEIASDFEVQDVYTRCMNDKYQLMLGRSICVNLVYPNVKTSRTHAYFPLSGPFELTCKMEKMDNVHVFNFIWESEVDTEGRLLLHFNHFGKGDQLTRTFTSTVTLNKKEAEMSIDAEAPEFQLVYKFYFQSPQYRSGNMRRFESSSLIWMEQQPVLGWKMLFESEYGSGKRSEAFTLNMTNPGASFEITLRNSRTTVDKTTIKEREMISTFYCSKERPLLYMLHISPLHAAQHGDITRLELTATNTIEKDDEDWWRYRTRIDKADLSLYDYSLSLETNLNRVGDDYLVGDSIFTYNIDGEMKTIQLDENIKDKSTEDNSNYDINLNMNGEDFNMVMTGTAVGNPKDFKVTAEIEYVNEEDSNVASRRKKRSIKSILQRFNELEQAAVQSIKALVSGDTETVDEVPPVVPGTDMMAKLPNMIPDFPSIWDIPKWTASIEVSGKLVPVFDPSSPPGKPVGVEYHTAFDITHPWNGGYKNVKHAGKVGKNLVISFRNFKYWIEGVDNSTYTTLDGTPILTPEGEPMVVHRWGDIHLERRAGEMFSYDYHHHGPWCQITYEIMFDWDSYSHHEPLVHVVSRHNNLLIPFLNHQYEERLYWEHHHLKHSWEFSNEWMTLNIYTDLDMEDDINFYQNGSLDLQAFGKSGSWKFVNKHDGKKNGRHPIFTLEVTSGSTPDTTNVYEYSIVNDRLFRIAASVKKAPSTEDVDIYTIEYAMVGARTREVTYTWDPVIHDKMAAKIRMRMIKIGLYLQGVTAYMDGNIGKPIMDQKVLLTQLTPRMLVQKYVFPRVMMLGQTASNVIANFVPLKKRQQILDSPGPKLPPRILTVLGELKKAQGNGEGSPVVYSLQTVEKNFIKLMSYALLGRGSSKVQMEMNNRIIEERKYVMAWTVPWISDRFGDIFPDTPESIRQIIKSWNDLLVYSKQHYYSNRETPVKVATIYGRHGDSRPLYIHTFDGTKIEIPADYARDCTYLLIADVKQKQFSVVLSPAGLTVLTHNAAVTVGYNNAIYVDNCKEPSKEMLISLDEGNLTVSRSDDHIEVTTPTGLALTCYDIGDVCIIKIQGSFNNNTIGLLGTNDFEKSTDMRLLNGQLADHVGMFLSDYVLDGPDSCRAASAPTDVDKSEPCNEPLHKLCSNWFQYKTETWKCRSNVLTRGFLDVCLDEAKHCESKDVDMCYSLRAFTGTCTTARPDIGTIVLPDFCTAVPQQQQESDKAGSLDVVFVVSEHKSMTLEEDGIQLHEYIKRLIGPDQSENWKQYQEVRMGIVGFGGFGNDYVPHVIWQGNGMSHFSEMSSFNWASLHDRKPVGEHNVDGFQAIETALTFPFKLLSHKMIVLLMTKEQSTGIADDPDMLKSKLLDQGIVLNVVSTYAKLASRRIIGMNFDGETITKDPGYSVKKKLPQNDYTRLVTETKGALWDINTLSRGRESKLARIVEEFVTQTKGSTCPAA